jgi:hypothetical protein
MTHSILRVSAIAVSTAAFVSLYSLSASLADTSAEPAPTPSTAPAQSAAAPDAKAPSLSEPAPTPGWAESAPDGTTVAQHPNGHHYARHYAWRNGHRYAYYTNNPVGVAARGMVGGVADLGSLAAYPIYCFPNYGSCPVYWPSR